MSIYAESRTRLGHDPRAGTALTSLGIDPPAIDVWDFAGQDGRFFSIERTKATESSS